MSRWFKRFTWLRKDEKPRKKEFSDVSRSNSLPGLQSKQEVLDAKRQASNKTPALGRGDPTVLHPVRQSCPTFSVWKRDDGVDPKLAPDPVVVDFCYDIVEEMVNRAASRSRNGNATYEGGGFCLSPLALHLRAKTTCKKALHRRFLHITRQRERQEKPHSISLTCCHPTPDGV